MKDPTGGEKPMEPELEAEDFEMRRLIRGAGARPAPPAERLDRIRSAARDEWRRATARPASPAHALGRLLPVAVAAVLLIVVALVLRSSRDGAPVPPPASPKVATVELVRGGGTALAVGTELAAGAELETGSGAAEARIALRLAGGGSLRLDAGSRARLVSGREIELQRGALYFDSDGAAAGAPPVEVVTPLGRVREIGTRFEVRLDSGAGSGLDVSVRDGRVVLAEDSTEHEIARGEALRLAADGTTERRSIDPRGRAWDWTLDLAAAPAIEGRSLAEFLAWLERETGWEIRFEDAGLAESAAGIGLHGSVAGLAPLEAAEVVLAGAGLELRLEERTLRIGRR